nr:MAG TPA: hypothetical protein [Caudoviricetes sp.]
MGGLGVARRGRVGQDEREARRSNPQDLTVAFSPMAKIANLKVCDPCAADGPLPPAM